MKASQFVRIQKKRFSTNKVPAILSDIDGVVYRGGAEIGNSSKVISSLLSSKVLDNRFKIPFSLLTNGGGVTEWERAEVVNKITGLEIKADGQKVQEDDIIVCHSPFRGSDLVNQYKDKFVLVSGLGKVLDVARYYGYKKAIDIEELFALYPQTCPVPQVHYGQERIDKLKKQVLGRLRMSEEQLKREMAFDAIFLWSDAINVEMNVQLFSDLLITKDGRIGGELRQEGDLQKVKLYLTNPDVVYADKYPIPRHGQGILIYCLKAALESTFKMTVDFIQYGKPETVTFDFAEKVLREKARVQGAEISNFYMIGDNPHADILGANRKGWNSILVRTGIFSGAENDEQYPAKYVVQDMEEALRLISKIENIKIEI